MLALYLSPTSGHSPFWARTCLTCADVPEGAWSECYLFLSVYLCAHVGQEVTLERCSSGTVHLSMYVCMYLFIYLFIEIVLSLAK